MVGSAIIIWWYFGSEIGDTFFSKSVKSVLDIFLVGFSILLLYLYFPYFDIFRNLSKAREEALKKEKSLLSEAGDEFAEVVKENNIEHELRVVRESKKLYSIDEFTIENGKGQHKGYVIIRVEWSCPPRSSSVLHVCKSRPNIGMVSSPEEALASNDNHRRIAYKSGGVPVEIVEPAVPGNFYNYSVWIEGNIEYEQEKIVDQERQESKMLLSDIVFTCRYDQKRTPIFADVATLNSAKPSIEEELINSLKQAFERYQDGDKVLSAGTAYLRMEDRTKEEKEFLTAKILEFYNQKFN